MKYRQMGLFLRKSSLVSNISLVLDLRNSQQNYYAAPHIFLRSNFSQVHTISGHFIYLIGFCKVNWGLNKFSHHLHRQLLSKLQTADFKMIHWHHSHSIIEDSLTTYKHKQVMKSKKSKLKLALVSFCHNFRDCTSLL